MNRFIFYSNFLNDLHLLKAQINSDNVKETISGSLNIFVNIKHIKRLINRYNNFFGNLFIFGSELDLNNLGKYKSFSDICGPFDVFIK
tara:strand:+ start:1618 stop:1881 length:264 start_codon:yes stop_codon:yes gene_type:complete